MSGAAYISKLSGDLVVEETVRERRERDAGWMRRHKRSLGRNKQFRASASLFGAPRARKLSKQAEAAHARTITSRVNDFLERLPRLFTRRTAK